MDTCDMLINYEMKKTELFNIHKKFDSLYAELKNLDDKNENLIKQQDKLWIDLHSVDMTALKERDTMMLEYRINGKSDKWLVSYTKVQRMHLQSEDMRLKFFDLCNEKSKTDKKICELERLIEQQREIESSVLTELDIIKQEISEACDDAKREIISLNKQIKPLQKIAADNQTYIIRAEEEYSALISDHKYCIDALNKHQSSLKSAEAAIVHNKEKLDKKNNNKFEKKVFHSRRNATRIRTKIAKLNSVIAEKAMDIENIHKAIEHSRQQIKISSSKIAEIEDIRKSVIMEVIALSGQLQMDIDVQTLINLT